MFSLTGYFLDAVTLFCYFCKNIIHQTDQLFFKDGNQPDENDNKFSPLSYTPYKHWLYRQRCRVVSVFFPIVYYQNCVYRILG